MNKVLVTVWVPIIEEKFDVWIPLNKSLYNIIVLLVKAINEYTKGEYCPSKMPMLYDKANSKIYDINNVVIETTIRNGTELIMI